MQGQKLRDRCAQNTLLLTDSCRCIAHMRTILLLNIHMHASTCVGLPASAHVSVLRAPSSAFHSHSCNCSPESLVPKVIGLQSHWSPESLVSTVIGPQCHRSPKSLACTSLCNVPFRCPRACLNRPISCSSITARLNRAATSVMGAAGEPLARLWPFGKLAFPVGLCFCEVEAPGCLDPLASLTDLPLGLSTDLFAPLWRKTSGIVLCRDPGSCSSGVLVKRLRTLSIR